VWLGGSPVAVIHSRTLQVRRPGARRTFGDCFVKFGSMSRRGLLSVAAATALPSIATAQSRNGPVRLLVGFAPGGTADTIGRLLAARLRDELGRPVMVENRPGVGGRLAAEALKNAAPDGQTFLVGPNAAVVFPALQYPVSVLRYDLMKDLQPVGVVTTYPMGMAVSSNVPAKNLKEYVAWVKDKPIEGSVGVAGLGFDTHFQALQFGKLAGVSLTAVAYRGNAPLMADLVANQIPAGMMVAGDFIQYTRAGKARALGIFGPKRSELMSEIPTFAEQGYDTGPGDGWLGVWAPAGTASEHTDKLQAALRKIVAEPAYKKTLAERVMHADFRGPDAMKQMLVDELKHWDPIIKASGYKPE
jgi:tripartite-type tricarboxylate transporter receptor subunit TctC